MCLGVFSLSQVFLISFEMVRMRALSWLENFGSNNCLEANLFDLKCAAFVPPREDPSNFNVFFDRLSNSVVALGMRFAANSFVENSATGLDSFKTKHCLHRRAGRCSSLHGCLTCWSHFG